MWPSSVENNSSSTGFINLASSSKSSSSSSSRLPPRRKIMEEVWKDISLSGLQAPRIKKRTILQDVLSRDRYHQTSTAAADSDISAAFASRAPLRPPTTVLSLNSVVAEFQPQNSPPAFMASSFLSKTPGGVGGDDCGDRRHKRMIKNRESAARSRARKQAYTNELELNVAHLRQENARLQAEFSAAQPQPPQKCSLRRTLTAPF